MEIQVKVHHEDGSYWAEVHELPGCFASGDTVEELVEAVQEAVQMYLTKSPAPVGAAQTVELSSFTVATSARLQPA